MPSNDPHSRFDLVAMELRALGINLRRLPGEYCVNFRNGGDHTARMADNLDQALELGRQMAAEAASYPRFGQEAAATQIATQEDHSQGAASSLYPQPQSPHAGTVAPNAAR